MAFTDFQRPCREMKTVADATFRCHSRATRAQFKLGGVSPNGLQIPPENFSYSAVTNRLIRGYQLKKLCP